MTKDDLLKELDRRKLFIKLVETCVDGFLFEINFSDRFEKKQVTSYLQTKLNIENQREVWEVMRNYLKSLKYKEYKKVGYSCYRKVT